MREEQTLISDSSYSVKTRATEPTVCRNCFECVEQCTQFRDKKNNRRSHYCRHHRFSPWHFGAIYRQVYVVWDMLGSLVHLNEICRRFSEIKCISFHSQWWDSSVEYHAFRSLFFETKVILHGLHVRRTRSMSFVKEQKHGRFTNHSNYFQGWVLICHLKRLWLVWQRHCISIVTHAHYLAKINNFKRIQRSTCNVINPWSR